jgi:hypothetical protein
LEYDEKFPMIFFVEILQGFYRSWENEIPILFK